MPLMLPDDPLELRSFLPFRLAVLSHRLSKDLARRYEQRFGIGIPEWRCMAVLARTGGLTARQLADRTSLDKVQTSRATARLVDRGLIARTTDQADRRAVRLALTSAGRDLFADIAIVAREWERELTSSLGLSDRRALERVLDKLDRALDGHAHGAAVSSDQAREP